MQMQILIGTGLAVVISAAAYRAGSLSGSGALAALFLGAVTFGLGGAVPAALLLAFFISSSLLSRLGAARKAAVGEKFAKGSRRDHGQVLANGSLAALFSLLLGIGEKSVWALAGVAGALAAVTADTWATELGVLARSRPRLVTNWQPVVPGTSGAVTWEGTLASLGGGMLIGGIAGLAGGWKVGVAAAAGGLAGSLLDSLMGASVQARYRCAGCRATTEKHPVHSCGAETRLSGGWSWLDNDLVNFIASAAGAVLAIWLALLL